MKGRGGGRFGAGRGREKEGRERNGKGAGIRKLREESWNRAADWLRPALTNSVYYTICMYTVELTIGLAP